MDLVLERRPGRRVRADLTRNLNLVQSPKTEHLLGVNTCFTDLSGYARTHPGASLDRWWPEFRMAALAAVTFVTVGPLARPDGHGVFTDAGGTVAFSSSTTRARNRSRSWSTSSMAAPPCTVPACSCLCCSGYIALPANIISTAASAAPRR